MNELEHIGLCGEKQSFFALYRSPLGEMRMESDGAALTALYFSGQRHAPESAGCNEPRLPVFKQTAEWLEVYFAGERPAFTPPLRLAGTPFQTLVWELLGQIPYGETSTYGMLAKEIAARKGLAKMAAQAVGNAVGRNPVALIVPCHRVIGANGSLTGYAAGLWRKEKLLLLEKP